MKRILAVVLVSLIALIFWGCPASEKTADNTQAVSSPVAVSSDYGAKTKRAPEAEKAPFFSVAGLNGTKVTLADLKGKVIILDFWATWCPPCRAEIPDFIALQKEYGGKDFVMIGAAVDEEAKVKNFVKNNRINYTVFIADQDISNNYGGIRGIPTTFVIDREGYIVRQYVGFRPKEVFEQDIKDLM